MIELSEKVDVPYDRMTIMSVNEKAVHGATNRNNITELNIRGCGRQASGSLGPGMGAVSNPSSPFINEAAGNPRRDLPNIHEDKRQVPDLVNPIRKGQKIPLGQDTKTLKINVCLGWDAINPACDLDVSAFLLSEGRVIGDSWFVFYSQKMSPDGSTVLSESGGMDRQVVTVDFRKLDARVDRIVFVLTIDEAFQKNLNFSMVKDAYIRILDSAAGTEIASFMMDEYYSNVISMMIGEIYLYKGEWKFNAVGNGVAKDLAGLCSLYGVQVD